MVLGKLNSHMQEKETGQPSSPCTKINSKWIKDLNIKPETIKLLEENIWGKQLDIYLGNNFLDLTPKRKVTKETYISGTTSS